jgi:alanyl-tRNA synthetase
LWKQFQFQQTLIQSLKTIFTCDEKEIADRVSVLTETNKKLSRQLRETTLLWIRETLKNAKDEGSSGSLIEIPPDLPIDTKKIFSEMNEVSTPVIAFQFKLEQKRFQIISSHPRNWNQMFSDFLKSGTIQGGGNPNFFQGKINGHITKEQFTDILHYSMKENKND